MKWTNPFHSGELKAQRLAGETQQAKMNSAIIEDKLMPGTARFLLEQQLAIVSTRDAQGRRWASLLFGEKGFLQPEGRTQLRIVVSEAQRANQDPLWQNLASANDQPALAGVLIIELQTRRRIRVNGQVHLEGNTVVIDVLESYVNCPKYITQRELEVGGTQEIQKRSKVSNGHALTTEHQQFLSSADLLFLATGHPERGADASHRGGNPGFIEVVSPTTLRIPDYSGNSMFNTFGNLLEDPHFGMVIPDFRNASQLQLTGTAQIDWNAPDAAQKSGGTHRFIDFHIEAWRESPLPRGVKDHVLQYSPYNPE